MKILKAIVPLICFSLLVSCSDNKTLKSDTIKNSTARIAILKKHIKPYSEIKDAEFYLFNSDGFDGGPTLGLGPADINYDFVVKVNPLEINKWKQNLIETTGGFEYERLKSLTEKRAQNWITSSKPKFYKDKDIETSLVIIFEEEGIVYEQINLN